MSTSMGTSAATSRVTISMRALWAAPSRSLGSSGSCGRNFGSKSYACTWNPLFPLYTRRRSRSPSARRKSNRWSAWPLAASRSSGTSRSKYNSCPRNTLLAIGYPAFLPRSSRGPRRCGSSHREVVKYACSGTNRRSQRRSVSTSFTRSSIFRNTTRPSECATATRNWRNVGFGGNQRFAVR